MDCYTVCIILGIQSCSMLHLLCFFRTFEPSLAGLFEKRGKVEAHWPLKCLCPKVTLTTSVHVLSARTNYIDLGKFTSI